MLFNFSDSDGGVWSLVIQTFVEMVENNPKQRKLFIQIITIIYFHSLIYDVKYAIT